jgi:OOP family OmpA-OmpF porin
MKNRLTAAALALALAIPGFAEARPGPYLSFGAGPSLQDDVEAASGGVTNTFEFERPSLGAFAAIGYGLGKYFRTELETSYRRATPETVSGTGSGNATGIVETVGVMANFLVDIPTDSIITPYVGGGVGGAYLRFDDVGSAFAGNAIHDDPIQFAFQGIAGVAFEIGPNFDFTVDYRYFRTMEGSFNLANGGGSADAEYSNHSLMMGVRFTFGEDWDSRRKVVKREEVVLMPKQQAVAAPYVATPMYQTGTSSPSPVPIYTPPTQQVQFPPPVIITGSPEVYVVYFDYNSHSLSLDAKDTLVRAAGAYKNGNVPRITVSGHTDTSGSSRYNKRLSKRRAGIVKDYLVTLGVPPLDIATKALGESQLPVPTPDGTKEAKNRRAEILMN